MILFIFGFLSGIALITLGFFVFDRSISKEFLTAEELEKKQPGWKHKELLPDSNSVTPAVAYEIRKLASKRGEKSE